MAGCSGGGRRCGLLLRKRVVQAAAAAAAKRLTSRPPPSGHALLAAKRRNTSAAHRTRLARIRTSKKTRLRALARCNGREDGGGGRPVFRVGQVLGEAVAAAEEDTAVVLTFWCARRRHAVRARARVRTHAIR